MAFNDDYVSVFMKSVFVKDSGNGHLESRYTIRRRVPKVRMSKKERIKKRWEGREVR